jgi:hypothetical protein
MSKVATHAAKSPSPSRKDSVPLQRVSFRHELEGDPDRAARRGPRRLALLRSPSSRSRSASTSWASTPKPTSPVAGTTTSPPMASRASSCIALSRAASTPCPAPRPCIRAGRNSHRPGDPAARQRKASPCNTPPTTTIMYVAMVDAGTVEFLRSLGKEIVSSADLVSQFEAVLKRGSDRQPRSRAKRHRYHTGRGLAQDGPPRYARHPANPARLPNSTWWNGCRPPCAMKA